MGAAQPDANTQMDAAPRCSLNNIVNGVGSAASVFGRGLKLLQEHHRLLGGVQSSHRAECGCAHRMRRKEIMQSGVCPCPRPLPTDAAGTPSHPNIQQTPPPAAAHPTQAAPLSGASPHTLRRRRAPPAPALWPPVQSPRPARASRHSSISHSTAWHSTAQSSIAQLGRCARRRWRGGVSGGGSSRNQSHRRQQQHQRASALAAACAHPYRAVVAAGGVL